MLRTSTKGATYINMRNISYLITFWIKIRIS